MTSMSGFRFKYFEDLEKRFANKKDFLKAYTNYVKSTKSGANCMFCLSFLCCCCCSILGRNSLMLSDLGRHWANSMSIYENIDSNKVRHIFINVMMILRKVKKQLEEKNKRYKVQLQEALYASTVNEYDSIKSNQVTHEIGELYYDQWMYKLFNAIYNPSLNHNNYSLAPEEINLLFIALPLFYPATVKEMNWAFKFDDKIAVMIKDLLQKL